MRPANAKQERFPEEIADALIALGPRDNRNLLARLWDGELVETDLSNGEVTALDRLTRAGLARKQIYDTTDDGEITAVYRISEYGKRFVECLIDTLGEIETATET